MPRLHKAIVHDLRLCWKKLLWTDAFYKVIAFAALTPIVTILFQLFLSISGRDVLADQDILFFFIKPVGWICVIVVGGVAIAILALEQAALMSIVRAAGQEERMGVMQALTFTARKAWPVLNLTARIVAIALLLAAPFLAVGGVTYLVLLTDYDINYYLMEKPPEFWLAIAAGGLYAVGLAALLVSLASCWLFALPLLLFEDEKPLAALRASREKTRGRRRKLALSVAGWAACGFAASAVGTGAINLLGRFVVPQATASLVLLVLTVGIMLILWGIVHFGLSAMLSASFATLLVNLYQRNRGVDEPPPTPVVGDAAKPGLLDRLTRKQLVVGTLTLGMLAAIVGGVFLRAVRMEDHTEIIAHRGSSVAAPENTMAAVLQAIEDQADWVEIDVQETRDGEIVLMHDSDFKKIAGSDMKIWNATMDDLKDLDIGSWFDPKFSDQRIATLDEVLKKCRGKIGVNIELKYYGHDEQLEQRVIDIVEANDMQSDIVIMSLKREAVEKMKQLRQNWRVGLLAGVAFGDLTKVDADFLAVSSKLATRSFIRSAHRAGKEVYVWTVNDPLMMSTVIGRGADGLITDEPAVARRVLEQRAKMGSIERLMVEAAMFFGASPPAEVSLEDA